jgi:hypothetical protein
MSSVNGSGIVNTPTAKIAPRPHLIGQWPTGKPRPTHVVRKVTRKILLNGSEEVTISFSFRSEDVQRVRQQK